MPHAQVDHFIALEGAQIENASAYDTLLTHASSAEPQRPELDGEDAYSILYTSGTTGQPKGAVLPHRQVLWNAINTVISWGLSENDVSPILTPMFHSGGLFIFLVPLSRRRAGHHGCSFDPDAPCSRWRTLHRVLGVPTLFQVWMNSPAFSQLSFKHAFLRRGGPLPGRPDQRLSSITMCRRQGMA
jgi:fatty-acyl-CoA synthase